MFLISLEKDRLQKCHFESICEHLQPCAPHWTKIAFVLGFTNDEVEAIANDLENSVSNSYLDVVISNWLKWEPGDARGSKTHATLEKLKAAVKYAGSDEIASQLTLGMY